jgi:hypothetical protein
MTWGRLNSIFDDLGEAGLAHNLRKRRWGRGWGRGGGAVAGALAALHTDYTGGGWGGVLRAYLPERDSNEGKVGSSGGRGEKVAIPRGVSYLPDGDAGRGGQLLQHVRYIPCNGDTGGGGAILERM